MGILAGVDKCYDFYEQILERGVIYCLGYYVSVANLFNPHVVIGRGYNDPPDRSFQ